jgi:alpha-glucoside transport system permease protein
MTDHAEPIFEIAPREAISPPRRRRSPTHWRAAALLLPALTVIMAVLVAPLLVTVVESFAAGAGGLRNYEAVVGDPSVRHAITNSLRWLLFAPLVCLAGLALSWPGRRLRRPGRVVIGVLAAPVAVSALVTGAAFRLLFEPQPGSGTVTAVAGGITFLGSGWIWVVLGLAFTWQWLGLAAVVFRASVAGMPADLVRVARAFGAGRLRQARAVALPVLLPAGALVLIIVLVAAARVFELVLAVAPGAVQDQVDVVGVHLWRFGPLLGTGESAALAVLLLAFVAIVALAGLWGLRREWPTGQPAPSASARPAQARPVPPVAVLPVEARAVPAGTVLPAQARAVPAGAAIGAAGRWGVRAFGAAVALIWTVPIGVLLLTSLHTPLAAATTGWWSGGWGWGSYQAAFAGGQLLSTLGSTAVHALVAAALLLVLAVPAAYALAWGGLPRPAARTLVAAATVLAVLPPQVVATPLGYILDHLQLLGAATPLILVHVAFGVPLAILLLRGAFASVPRETVSARQLDPVRGSALFAVVTSCWPALLAVAVFEIVLVWNDVLIGLLFGGTEAGAVTLVLFEQTRQFATSAGPLAADAVVITLFPLILVLATGRWLVRGLAEGVRR